jgi:hypothetical protein
MSDSDFDDTHISFTSITKQMNDLIDSKLKLDIMFKEFTNNLNNLNYYIGLYERHNVHPQLGNKKFCSNVNNNDECNNNNNRPKKRRTCCYTETDPQGKAEYRKGETELEKHKRLLEYEIKKVAMLEEKQQKAANKLVNELSLSINNNILDVNNRILFTRDNNSDTSTDSSNKNIAPNHSTSTPQINVHIPKSANNRDKKKEIRISKEKIDSSNISSTTPKPSVPTTLNDEDIVWVPR